MIFSFLISIPAFLLQALISVLPDGGEIPTEFVEGVAEIWGYINAFSFIVPIDTLLWCLGIAMFFHVAIFSFKAFHWIITKIPFIG